MIDDATLERGLRARPPADPIYRSRITETSPTAIRPSMTGPNHAQPRRTGSMRIATSLVVIISIVALGAIMLSVGGDPEDHVPAASPTPSGPAASRLECGNHTGTWSFPIAAPDLATTAQETAEVLGCSADGTRALIQKGRENLFVLDADGSETQVTEQLSGFTSIVGSSRPTGATISPDGSRIVFAGLTKRALSCHDGALFGVGADGGPTWAIWQSQIPQNGIVRDPAYSPDGARIAFADGYCDSSHGVWVMNADGSDAHQIVSTDFGPLGATHVQGVAWSPDGDRIAIAIDDGTYTFATDGSDFRKGAAPEYCWPGRQC